jgi:hypothetical protein
MSNADIALHPIHITTGAVDAIPTFKASGFEVTLHFSFF